MKISNLFKLYFALFSISGTLVFAGCSLLRDDTVEIIGVSSESSEYTEDSSDSENDAGNTEAASGGAEEGLSDVSAEPELQEDTTAENQTVIYVYVCGAVMYPGVYELEEGSRAVDALKAAGGFSDIADTDAINLARQVYDGEQLYIPYDGEDYTPDTFSDSTDNKAEEAASDSLVNINTADLEELKTLSGIGDAKASAIIEYRKQHGNFNSIDEIINVNGIGDALYQQIKDYITV